MTPLPGKTPEIHIPAFNIRFNWRDFVQEHLIRSVWLLGWLLGLGLFSGWFVYGRFLAAPTSTTAVFVLWIATVCLTVFNEISHRHNSLTRWLRHNLYNSITNILVTLILVLGILAAIFSLYRYAWVNANFYTIPAEDLRASQQPSTNEQYCFQIGRIAEGTNALVETQTNCFAASTLIPDTSSETAPLCFDTQLTDPENGRTCFVPSAESPFYQMTLQFTGANWGAVAANMGLMMVFRFDRLEIWRVWAVLVMIVLLFIPSQFVYRAGFPQPRLRRWLTYAWLASPLVAFLFLRGVPPVPFETTSLGSILRGTTQTVFEWQSYSVHALDTGTATLLNGVLVVADPLTGEPARDESGALVGNVPSLTRWFGTLWLNRALYGVIGTAVFGVALWVFGRYFPVAEREAEWVRIGRFVLQVLFGISAVFATLALLKVAMLLIGSITWTVETAEGELIRKPIFSDLNPDLNWGGFLLTLIITIFAIVVSFPIGLVLALGRRSNIPGIPAWLTYTAALAATIYLLRTTTPANLLAARNSTEQALAYWPLLILLAAYIFQWAFQGNVLRTFSTLYIEFIRGMPLIAVLFLATQLFPLFIPRSLEIQDIWRVIWGVTLFSAAYLAENVRGGLQAIPKGQYEAADSLGLGTFDKYSLIILPQAIRIVIPALVGQFIALFKDTSLVAIVGLLDVLGVANAISAQPQWLGVRREAYLFLAFLYFVGSAVMTLYSRRLEKQLGLGER